MDLCRICNSKDVHRVHQQDLFACAGMQSQMSRWQLDFSLLQKTYHDVLRPSPTIQGLEIIRSIDSFEAGSTWEKKSPIENVYHASLAAVNASASEVHMFFIF